MSRYVIIIVAITLASGISQAGVALKTKPGQTEDGTSLFAQSDQSLSGRKLQAPGDRKVAGSKGKQHRLMRRQLEKFRLSKLLELLELGEDQRERFLPLFAESRDELGRTTREKAFTVRKLGKLLKRKKSSESEIQELIDEISALERQIISQRKTFMAGCHEILNSVQLGKLIVFQDRFELDMLGKLRGFRGRGKGMQLRQRMPDSSIEDRQDSNFIRDDSDR